MKSPLFLLVFAAAAVACFVGVVLEEQTLVLVTKPLLVLALMGWVATSASVATRREPWVYRVVLLALLFSMVGDIILELDKAYFVFGLGSFLVAHIFYVAAFVIPKRGRKPHLVVALPFLAWGVGVLVFVWPGLAAKGMEIPVVVYVAVITTMMWRAAARADERPTISQWACLMGAMIFGLSDSLIAIRDFHAPFDWAKYGILSTYWAGQLGIAFAFVFDDDTR